MLVERLYRLVRTGSPWRDLKRSANGTSCSTLAGRAPKELAAPVRSTGRPSGLEYLIIDSTTVGVQQHASDGRVNSGHRPVPRPPDDQKFACLSVAWAVRPFSSWRQAGPAMRRKRSRYANGFLPRSRCQMLLTIPMRSEPPLPQSAPRASFQVTCRGETISTRQAPLCRTT